MYHAQNMNSPELIDYLVLRVSSYGGFVEPELLVVPLQLVLEFSEMTKDIFTSSIRGMKSAIFSSIQCVWVEQHDHSVFAGLSDDDIHILVTDVKMSEMAERSNVNVAFEEIKIDRNGDIWFVAYIEGGAVVETKSALTRDNLGLV